MKLHLGAAKRRLVGFINIDRELSEGIDLVSDVKKLDSFPESSAIEIYSSHTLEYFDRSEALEVLREWGRVLAPGGRLFVSVPDFRQLIRIYESSGRLATVLGPLFGKWHNPNNGETIYHKTVWDYESLKKCLEDSGFGEVSPFDPVVYLASIDEGFDDYSLAYYPHMDRSGVQVSLCLTAVKY
jgi:predicted SAM-dependent methyltransferase